MKVQNFWQLPTQIKRGDRDTHVQKLNTLINLEIADEIEMISYCYQILWNLTSSNLELHTSNDIHQSSFSLNATWRTYNLIPPKDNLLSKRNMTFLIAWPTSFNILILEWNWWYKPNDEKNQFITLKNNAILGACRASHNVSYRSETYLNLSNTQKLSKYREQLSQDHLVNQSNYCQCQNSKFIADVLIKSNMCQN